VTRGYIYIFVDGWCYLIYFLYCDIDFLVFWWFRFTQRAPVSFLQCPVIKPLLCCGIAACALDHKDANASVTKFWTEFAKAGREKDVSFVLLSISHLETSQIFDSRKGSFISACHVMSGGARCCRKTFMWPWWCVIDMFWSLWWLGTITANVFQSGYQYMCSYFTFPHGTHILVSVCLIWMVTFRSRPFQ
jgi:hypothetical protein